MREVIDGATSRKVCLLGRGNRSGTDVIPAADCAACTYVRCRGAAQSLPGEMGDELSISACSLPFDFAMRRSCTRLRTFRRVSIGPRRNCDVPMMDSVSESDSHTDCSPCTTDVDVETSPLVNASVLRRPIDVPAAGLGTGLQLCDETKIAWSNGDRWGSMVTGSIKRGGEIADGSICVLSPWMDDFVCGTETPPFAVSGGGKGKGFNRGDDAAGAPNSRGSMVGVVEDSLLHAASGPSEPVPLTGVDGGVHALDSTSGVADGR